METKILFLDLDGTLLNDEKQITPGNRRAVEETLARGHRVVICSGRPLVSALALAQSLGLAGEGCYVIAFNGAVIYDCGQQCETFRRNLEMEVVCTLFDEAHRRGIHIQTYDGQGVVVDRLGDDEEIRAYCDLTHMQFRVVEDIRSGLDAPPMKALLIGEDRRVMEDMQAWIGSALAGKVNCFFSSRTFLEVVLADIDKGTAVRTLCQKLGIPLEHAVAVGDESNDVPMILAAGTGVAMKNAADAIKAAADYVTQHDNNHDAIAEVAARFL